MTNYLVVNPFFLYLQKNKSSIFKKEFRIDEQTQHCYKAQQILETKGISYKLRQSFGNNIPTFISENGFYIGISEINDL